MKILTLKLAILLFAGSAAFAFAGPSPQFSNRPAKVAPAPQAQAAAHTGHAGCASACGCAMK